jgi:hypothetical protein
MSRVVVRIDMVVLDAATGRRLAGPGGRAALIAALADAVREHLAVAGTGAPPEPGVVGRMTAQAEGASMADIGRAVAGAVQSAPGGRR